MEKYQSGFRVNHSTVTRLRKLCNFNTFTFECCILMQWIMAFFIVCTTYSLQGTTLQWFTSWLIAVMIQNQEQSSCLNQRSPNIFLIFKLYIMKFDLFYHFLFGLFYYLEFLHAFLFILWDSICLFIYSFYWSSFWKLFNSLVNFGCFLNVLHKINLI